MAPAAISPVKSRQDRGLRTRGLALGLVPKDRPAWPEAQAIGVTHSMQHVGHAAYRHASSNCSYPIRRKRWAAIKST